MEDDAAHVNMGGDWCMPTPDQIEELINNTTNTWTTQDGANGRLFTSKTDTSKSIFIPAAGYAWDDSVYYSGDGGCFWSSMLNTGHASHGKSFMFGSDSAYLDYNGRSKGYSIRGIIRNY